jgi:hypothetical protein
VETVPRTRAAEAAAVANATVMRRVVFTSCPSWEEGVKLACRKACQTV